MRTLIVSLAFVAICMCGCHAPTATEDNPCKITLYSGGQIIKEWEAISYMPNYHTTTIDFITKDGTKFHIGGTFVVEGR